MPTQEAKEYADSIGAVFAETSALTAQNVLSLFEAISTIGCMLISENMQ